MKRSRKRVAILSPRLVAIAGGLLSLAPRLASVWGRWRLPVAQGA